jgi:hypothetical protein
VDDDGIGYKDDGEEHLGLMEDPQMAKKRAIEDEIDGDKKTSKKMKKLMMMGTAAFQKNTMLNYASAGLSSNKDKGLSHDVAPGSPS